VLHLPRHRVDHSIDILGTVLLTAGAGALTLALTLGGTEWAWGSGPSVGLFVSGGVLIALFLLQENRAAEPIIPLHLFRNVIFNAASGGGFILGLAMFGSIVYVPLFLQIVHGVSPTSSGLRLLPMMASLLITSIVTGQTISRIGRYKIFPVVGMAVVTAGMIMLSRLNPSTSTLRFSLYLVVLGAGMGLVMQVLMLAVQNAVEYRDLGAATSSATFLRSMGGVFGLAIFGAIFAGKLAYWMPRLIPKQSAGSLAGKDPLHMTPAQLRGLPPQVHQGLIDAFSNSIHSVFLWSIPFAVAGFLITLFLREIPLRERKQPVAAAAPPEAGEVEPEPVGERR
ncbi:MAG: MFS transporter, partial [Gaiellaceae bacterium]